MSPVPSFDLKFLIEFAATGVGTSNRPALASKRNLVARFRRVLVDRSPAGDRSADLALRLRVVLLFRFGDTGGDLQFVARFHQFPLHLVLLGVSERHAVAWRRDVVNRGE